jgi:thioredoxin-related protein
MKRFLFPVFFSLSANVFSQGISFVNDTSLAQLTQRAIKENKPIFIDCYTTWCGPCKWMSKNIFPNDTVGKFFNDSFVSVKIDMEKGEGKSIARDFQINAYPTFLFLSPQGKELHRFVGSMRASDFIKNSRIVFDEKNRLSALKSQYESGNRETGFIRNYITACWKSGVRADTEMDWYIATLPDAEFNSKENFEFLWNNFAFLKEHGFKRILKYKNEFIAVNGVEKLNTMILSWALDEFMNCTVAETVINTSGLVEHKDVFKEDLFNVLVAKIHNINPDNKEYIINRLNYNRLQQTADLKGLLLFLKNDKTATAFDLNQTAWAAYTASNDPSDLETAYELALQSVALENKYYNNDTCAALAYKLKKKKEAKKYAQKAIELAKKEGENYTETEELLKKINALK